jgi:hypothetical protein
MTSRHQTRLLALSACLACAAPAARAVVVNIDATTAGCDAAHCNAVFLHPGDTVGAVFSPTQLTLGPGTYTVSNGSGLPGSNPSFSAWRVNGGPQWTWSFLIIDDATLQVVTFGCCSLVPGAPPAYFATQAAAAAQPYAQTYTSSFTLAKVTTLDFVTEDYFPADNAGGMSLSVTAVPEPPVWALAGLGLLGFGAARRRLALR